MSDIAKRFQRETAQHEMTVAHDDGLYRHLKFRHAGSNYSGYYWFDLITVPGALIFQGDGESYVFSREEDMFEFFRTSSYGGEPNYSYWAEKLTDGRERVQVYSLELMEQYVNEAVADVDMASDDRLRLEAAVRENVLAELCDHEVTDRGTVDRFEFYVDETDEFDDQKRPDFEFTDAGHWPIRDYYWWFLWACRGIVWGISKYDEHRVKAVA